MLDVCVWGALTHCDPPIVQFVVIFLLFGLCRNNSSSLLVGSHVVYFSPMPTKRKRKWERTSPRLHAEGRQRSGTL